MQALARMIHSLMHPTIRQTEALRIIAARPGLALGELAEAMGSRRDGRSTARPLVMALESIGLVARPPLRATAAGRRWLRAVDALAA